MSQVVERWWPYVLAALALAVWFWGLQAPFPSPSDALLGASGGASAVLVGFLATAKTVILSVSNAEVFKRLKAGKFHGLIFNYLFESITIGMVFLLVSMVGFFVDRDPVAPLWFAATWVGSGSLALFLFGRITHLLFQMLKWV